MFQFADTIWRQAVEGVDRDDLPYIQTFTGKKFRHMAPAVEDICLEDIAHGLSLLCRFTGQIKSFYSVAEHAVRGSYYCPEEFKLDFLHHDDTEAYYNDIARPLKRMPGMEFYRMYEDIGGKVIQRYFGLGPEPEKVKEIDQRMLETEMRDLFFYNRVQKEGRPKPFDDIIIPWTPEEAERRYLMRHEELKR